MKNIISVLILSICIGFSFAQQGLYDSSNELMFIIDSNQIIIPDGETILSTQGNLIFVGNSNKSGDLLYKVDVKDVFKKNKGMAIERDAEKVKWYISEGNFYYQKFDPRHVVVNIVKEDDFLAFYNSFNDSLLAYIPDPMEYSSAKIFAVFKLLWQYYDLENEYAINIDNTGKLPKEYTDAGIIGVMQARFDDGMAWHWDGRFLYPSFDRNPMLVWRYENDILKPNSVPKSREEWVWDGEAMKPYWGGNPKNEWSWRGGILRQVWNNNHNNEYIIDGHVVRKRFGNIGENEWEIFGEVPLPIITAIVLGIVFR